MASIHRRKGKWCAEVRREGFYRSKTFLHKASAKQWAYEIELTLERKESPDSHKLVSEAIDKHLEDVTPQKKGSHWESVRLNKFKTYKIAKKRLCDVKQIDMAQWRDDRLEEVSQASVLREMNLWSSFFSVCVNEWRWLRENPIKGVRRPKDSKSRDRIISDEEIELIAGELHPVGPIAKTKYEETGVLFLLALETGMRLSEMIKLDPKDRFADHVIVRDAKNNDDRKVPLTKRARELLTYVEVFTVTSNYASAVFRTTVRALKIEDLTFHDTRHTAATRLASKLSLLDLCRMFGWRDPRHAMIYYNPDVTDLAKKLETE